jgi:hypothetical protein
MKNEIIYIPINSCNTNDVLVPLPLFIIIMLLGISILCLLAYDILDEFTDIDFHIVRKIRDRKRK